MLRRLGATGEQLRSLRGEFRPELFDAKEQAAILYAERMTLDAHSISDEEFAALRDRFDEGEIVELTAVIGLFNYFNRFNDALQVDVTDPNEGKIE